MAIPPVPFPILYEYEMKFFVEDHMWGVVETSSKHHNHCEKKFGLYAPYI